MRTTSNKRSPVNRKRRGQFVVVGAVCMAGMMTFMAFSVDLGVASLTKSRMHNAVDAAALAAALEISEAVANGGENVSNVFANAQALAKAKAVTVAEMNGVFVDQSCDVAFGRRYFNSASNSYVIDWAASASQTNVVKVRARRTSDDKSAPDAKVPALFSGIISSGTTLTAEGLAYIEPRDMVVIHDFSRSMNFDSYFTDETEARLTQAQIEDNLEQIWADLQPLELGTLSFAPQYMSTSKSNTGATATVTFKGKTVSLNSNTAIKSVILYFTPGTSSQTFTISNETTKTGNWAGTGSNSGKRIKQVDVTIRKVGSSTQSWSLTHFDYNTTTISNFCGLSSVTYPYDSGSWSSYISFAQSNGGLSLYNYNDMYGGMTFICYLLKETPSHHQTADLWKTHHYPFHAIKLGHELLCEFLEELKFDDHLGMVSYDTSHRQETILNETGMPAVDLSLEPITNNYEAVRKLMAFKQAAHYSFSTNMGGGLKDGIAMLDAHKRDGSKPALILMTDGNSNTVDAGDSTALPAGWNWATLLDYNGDGVADYTTSDAQAQYVLKKVKEAVDKKYTVHAISVGTDADHDLLKAVAFLGGGCYVSVPGGSSTSEMEDQMRAAFVKIAGTLPPPRLIPPN